jgi:hypothetical protein
MLLNNSSNRRTKLNTGSTCQSNLADKAQSAPLLRKFKAEKDGPPGRIYYECRHIILRAAMVTNVDVEHIKMFPDLKQILGVVGWWQLTSRSRKSEFWGALIWWSWKRTKSKEEEKSGHILFPLLVIYILTSEHA